MKKRYKFTELSNIECTLCEKKLKKNVVERKAPQNCLFCFSCGEKLKRLAEEASSQQAKSYRKKYINQKET